MTDTPSENQGTEPEVERTTETTTESVDVPNHEDRREELRTPEPEVTQETVTETVSENPDGGGSVEEDPSDDTTDNGNEADADNGDPDDAA